MSKTTILVAHDGSALADAVLPAIEPMLNDDVHVALLHVSGSAPPAEIDTRFSALEAGIEKHGASHERVSVLDEDAAEGILKTAREREPHLLALTSHGASGIERWVRGSVAQRVLRNSPVPVLAVSSFGVAASRIDSILVPVDLDETSLAVLDPLMPIALAFGAKVTLLYVDYDDPRDPPDRIHRKRAERREKIDAFFAAPLQRLRDAKLETEFRIEFGDAAERILDAADPGDYDLVAMATHGREGPVRWLLGSVAEKVLREVRRPLFLHRARS